ncbi:hypothetical protein, partial [Vibrio vulnificus]|uniref:hypothetical protein n=1 Tax=Vibrio vulnificus TaxID=672 RepID=UPI00057D1BAA
MALATCSLDNPAAFLACFNLWLFISLRIIQGKKHRKVKGDNPSLIFKSVSTVSLCEQWHSNLR